MFSIGKFVMLAALIGAVFTLYRWFHRIGMLRQRARTAAMQPPLITETMVKCKLCGTYVPAQGARGCGRGDCPFGL